MRTFVITPGYLLPFFALVTFCWVRWTFVVFVCVGLGEDFTIVRVALRWPWAAFRRALPAPLSESLTAAVVPAGIEKPAVPIVSVFVFFFLPFLIVLLVERVSSPLQVAVPVQVSLTAAAPLQLARHQWE
jgi:hypothetical protein